MDLHRPVVGYALPRYSTSGSAAGITMPKRSFCRSELLLDWRCIGGRWIPSWLGIGPNRQVQRENINEHAQQHQGDRHPEPPVFVQFSAVLSVRMIVGMIVGVAHVLFERRADWWTSVLV